MNSTPSPEELLALSRRYLLDRGRLMKVTLTPEQKAKRDRARAKRNKNKRSKSR